MKPEIKHIFFDLDRTLWDFEANSSEALRDLYAEFELDQWGSGDPDYFIERYKLHNEHVWDLYRANRMSKARLRKERFRRALADIQVDDQRLTNRMSRTYMELSPFKSQLIEGALEIVQSLHGHYVLHILSNGFQEAQKTKLRVSGLEPYFDQVITSERASSRKPQARIFEFALKRARAQATESLMIGDHLEIDVRGALDAGWQAIHFNCNEEKHEFPSVTRLDELRGLLL